jgi:hypothetical protein
MPLTSGSFAVATYLYSLTVVMPELSGASAPFAICFSSSSENRPAWSPPPWPIAP